MFLVEWLVPLLLVLAVGYGSAAYKYGLPSPITSKHERALTHIAQLEIDLGYRQSPEEIARAEYQRQFEERVSQIKATFPPVTITKNPYRFTGLRANHDEVDLTAIDPKDRNPHQQDYS